ncbi:hypothetical protein H8356DRAFT_1675626 [Neocallimastix lanati (nom. inval.)]|nr:hypothetical protein H8356DRAFT_1675626 [Neocallimastix sp. JGI-2020a]
MSFLFFNFYCKGIGFIVLFVTHSCRVRLLIFYFNILLNYVFIFILLKIHRESK